MHLWFLFFLWKYSETLNLFYLSLLNMLFSDFSHVLHNCKKWSRGYSILSLQLKNNICCFIAIISMIIVLSSFYVSLILLSCSGILNLGYSPKSLWMGFRGFMNLNGREMASLFSLTPSWNLTFPSNINVDGKQQ